VDKKHQKEFFDQLALKWNIQKPDDWNKVTLMMAQKEGGNFISRYYNGSLTQGNIKNYEIIFAILSQHFSV
jgi:hypothetical protein